MKSAAKADKDAIVIAQLRSARSQLAAASRESRKMATGSKTVAAAQSLVLAGNSYDQLLGTVTSLVDDVSGTAQTRLAQAVNPPRVTAQIVRVLTGLVADVPASVQRSSRLDPTSMSLSASNDVVTMDAAVKSARFGQHQHAAHHRAIGIATSAIGPRCRR